MLIRSTELAKTYYILESGKKMYGETPLLNCVEFVIEGLKAQDFEFIKKLVLEDYAPVLRRDP